MSAEIEDHISSKYEIRRRIGKGAYGIVWKSVDRCTGEIVALKKIFDAFTNATDAQRTYREIMFLQSFSSHENVIKLLDVVRARNDQDIYLVFEFMDTDLHTVIRAKLLQPIHHQYIMYQLFKVMMYIHSGNCIHRDLKPSNILLNSQCFVKLADFGLARSLSSLSEEDCSSNPAMTDYVATRWYRAPEILLGSHKYTKGVDMWSLGCVAAEMIAGKPLFPGSSTMNQMDRIMTSVPQPTRLDIESLNAPYAHAVLDQIMRRHRTPITAILPSASEDALDLLSRLVLFNPDHRLTSEQALQHPYVARFHDPDDEPILAGSVVPYLDDNVQRSIDLYRTKLYESITQKREEIVGANAKSATSVEANEVTPERERHAHASSRGDSSPSLHSQSANAIAARPHPSHSPGRPSTTGKSPASAARPPAYMHTGSPPHRTVSRHPSAPPQGRRMSGGGGGGGGGREKDMLEGTDGASRKRELNASPLAQARRPRPFSSAIQPSHTIISRHTSEPPPQGSREDISDFVITSARIVPSQRPATKQKKPHRDIPSSLAKGTYTQTHGTITQSSLSRLRKEAAW